MLIYFPAQQNMPANTNQNLLLFSRNVNLNMMKKRILIFDDDVEILEVLNIIFTELGCQVEVSQFSDNVLTRLNNYQPDLVLMDNLMPPVSGADAVQTIRKSFLFSHIPVILITACPDTATLCKKAGADGFLMKPFNINDLENLVKLHLML